MSPHLVLTIVLSAGAFIGMLERSPMLVIIAAIGLLYNFLAHMEYKP